MKRGFEQQGYTPADEAVAQYEAACGDSAVRTKVTRVIEFSQPKVEGGRAGLQTNVERAEWDATTELLMAMMDAE